MLFIPCVFTCLLHFHVYWRGYILYFQFFTVLLCIGDNATVYWRDVLQSMYIAGDILYFQYFTVLVCIGDNERCIAVHVYWRGYTLFSIFHSATVYW